MTHEQHAEWRSKTARLANCTTPASTRHEYGPADVAIGRSREAEMIAAAEATRARAEIEAEHRWVREWAKYRAAVRERLAKETK